MSLMKSEKVQICRLDAECDALGIARGIHEPGRKHGKYIVTLANGRRVTTSIAKTPRDIDDAGEVAVQCLRRQLNRALGRAP